MGKWGNGFEVQKVCIWVRGLDHVRGRVLESSKRGYKIKGSSFVRRLAFLEAIRDLCGVERK